MKKYLCILLVAILFMSLSLGVAAQDISPDENQVSAAQVNAGQELFTVSDVATFAVGDNNFVETEPNDYFSQANILGNDYTLYGTVESEDVDVYQISFTGYTAITAVSGAEYDSVWLALYDSNGNILQDSLDYGYSDGVYTKAVVCTLEPGVYYLAVGNYESGYSADYLLYYQSVATSAHTHFNIYETYTQPSDCMYEGYIIDYCNCGFYRIEWLPIADHKFGDYVSNGDGTMSAICSVCHLEYEAYELYRVKGKNRYATSFAIADATKQKMGVDRFDSVIIAYGENFADALAGSYLAKVKNAPIIMASGKDANNREIKNYLDANLSATGNVYILGGTAAVPQSTEDMLAGYNVKRIKGKTRYDTNIEILKEAGVTNQEIIVATGTNFADSLSASAVGKPILLVDGKKGLTDTQKNYLDGLSTEKFYIIGGTGAVGENFETEFSVYGTTERIKGKTRYETSVAIAEKFFTAPSNAVLAYAENFPDGLSGGPLAMSMNAPLILTKTGKQSVAAGYAHSNFLHTGIVLGGDILISDATAKEIFQTDVVAIWK